RARRGRRRCAADAAGTAGRDRDTGPRSCRTPRGSWLPVCLSWSMVFPIPFAVFGVRQHIPNEELSAVEMDDRDQPVFIATDVEHDETTDRVGLADPFA